ncbi:hypothetical protein Anapl_03658, partial [Anas platyrhynchos]
EPFLSLVLVLTEMDFSLDLQNCSFLDESWLLPVRARCSPLPPAPALAGMSNWENKELLGLEALP